MWDILFLAIFLCIFAIIIGFKIRLYAIHRSIIKSLLAEEGSLALLDEGGMDWRKIQEISLPGYLLRSPKGFAESAGLFKKWRDRCPPGIKRLIMSYMRYSQLISLCVCMMAVYVIVVSVIAISTRYFYH